MGGLFKLIKRRNSQLVTVLVSIGIVGLSIPGFAEHPVSVVEADVYVQRFKTTMRLKCFADDLELLQGVEPMEDGSYDSEELQAAHRDHAKFLAERIHLINSDGERIAGKITEVMDLELPEQGVRQGELMNYRLGYELVFGYDQPPEFLTIKQMIVAQGLLLPSEVKVLLKQEGSDTPYLQMLKPDAPETFRFDWTNPVLSKDASEKEWNEWFEEQREQTLGITSYSSVYSFIYITPREVRHEILIPLASLATVINFQRSDLSYLSVKEQDAAHQQISDFFLQDNPVVIDGIPVQPTVDRVDFYGLDLRDFAVQAERRKISMANGRIGVILSYGAKTPPSTVNVTWNLFNEAIKTVDSIIFAYDKIDKTQFSTFVVNNTFEWKSPEKHELPEITDVMVEFVPAKKVSVPIISIFCGLIGIVTLLIGRRFLGSTVAVVTAVLLGLIGGLTLNQARIPVTVRSAKLPDIVEELAGDVFAKLHANIFRAFDYHREEEIYDALAHSVDGPMLGKLYTQLRQSLENQQQGGAVSRIDHVQIDDGLKTDTRVEGDLLSFDYQCKWQLVGSVEHWGHIHQRTNIYDGTFTVSMVKNQWKITKIKELDEEQGPVKTTLRKF
jgi:hypothetical protein